MNTKRYMAEIRAAVAAFKFEKRLVDWSLEIERELDLLNYEIDQVAPDNNLRRRATAAACINWQVTSVLRDIEKMQFGEARGRQNATVFRKLNEHAHNVRVRVMIELMGFLPQRAEFLAAELDEVRANRLSPR